MKTSNWQTTISTQIAKKAGQRKWSRSRTLAVSGGVLFLLYAVLLYGLPGKATAAPLSSGPGLSTQPQSQPAPTVTPEAADEGVVSPALLAEFDRLADKDGAAVREELGGESTESSNLPSTMIFSLLLIVAAIYGGVWLYKRYGRPGSGEGLLAGGRLLAVQESQSIGPNQKLHLVRMGDEVLLIGATDQNISFLARYDGEVASSSFADQLRSAVTPESGAVGNSLDLNEGLQRLRGLGRSDRQGGSHD
ncbi:MAG: flagellar biosynthetic protein FliO [Caldilineaceae bacterium]|nr:flagellar biosynthetic protein FliO [Caldilineaceae bacterium]